MGGKIPTTDYTVTHFSIGIGTTPPTVADVGLEDPLSFYGDPSPVELKPIDGATWPSPFVTLVTFTLGATEANGNLITEMGLFTGNETLVARRVHIGINKTEDFAPTLGWRLRL